MRLACILALCSTALQAQTLDQIISRHLTARGGAKRIRALRTQVMDGTLAFAPNPGEPFHVEMKRPGKMRQEVTLNHDSFIQITDGHEGWTLRAGKPPEPMSAEQLKNLAGSADLDGPLLDYKSRGNRVELKGKEKVEGRDAYKLLVTMKDGTERTEYIDAKTYLDVKWEGTVGGEKMESYFRDYRKVKGLAYAFTIDSSGAHFKQKLVFTRIEVNVDLPDSRFTKP
ncbi:MAG TPA: hypothetical protein VGL53_21930 [Bryobacteraceae bacterium]|jgi:outer membrane lipoprotein-sorting protein